MQSDFELLEYARARRAALQKSGAILLVLGMALVAAIQLKVVSAWMVAATLVAVLVFGILRPIYWRRKHHPFRAETKEKRFTLALMLGCNLGYLCIVAAAVLWGIDGYRAYMLARLLALIGIGAFCTPIFFSYKTR
jgi:hypothetical protein